MLTIEVNGRTHKFELTAPHLVEMTQAGYNTEFFSKLVANVNNPIISVTTVAIIMQMLSASKKGYNPFIDANDLVLVTNYLLTNSDAARTIIDGLMSSNTHVKL